MALLVILEDELGISQYLSIAATRWGKYTEVETYVNPTSAIEAGALDRADVILTDFDMYGEDARVGLEYLKSKGYKKPVILNSGNHNAYQIIQQSGFGDIVTEVVSKTANKDEITEYLQYNNPDFNKE